MKKLILAIFILGVGTLTLSLSAPAQIQESKIKTSYNAESDKTTVMLPLLKLARNPKSFSIGALFQFDGDLMSERPCCTTFIFTSIGKKQFDYKDYHNVTFWADDEKLEFNNTKWREADEATAFVLAQIAFSEEIWVGMKTEEFIKIARAKRIKARVGSFQFEMTSEQRAGLAELADNIEKAK
ncbi:MAG: hypothetical protein ABI539_04105 [Acidobacteriota bacterium]